MVEPTSDNKAYELGHSTVTLRKDGIAELKCGDDTYYEIRQLEELNDLYEKIFNGKRHPILHIVGKYTSISPDARKWGATQEATRFSCAEAYVLVNLAQKIIGNFYMKFDKPHVPTKFFTTINEAEEWLKTFL